MEITQAGLAACGGREVGSQEEWARRGKCDVVEEIASGQAWGQVSESVEHSDRGGFPGLATGHLQSRRV